MGDAARGDGRRRDDRGATGDRPAGRPGAAGPVRRASSPAAATGLLLVAAHLGDHGRRRVRRLCHPATAEDGHWLEHFYLAPELQGQGIGSAVLRRLLDRTDAEDASMRLIVLRGSAAQRLYERHGFTVEHADPIDVSMVRRPSTPAR
ncbi:GNAT family N-acetyltransferase [Nonomuraea recticatena]|uniref:GNAT family N-acetyltransferase n=1 Tax=Nonomuraea recticatena TaxID=46178 RepID=UPI0031F8E47F